MTKAKITILGSGSYVSSINRYGASFLIEVDDRKILIDTGGGCQVRLNELGIKIKDINYIFITHFHPDHTCDLPSIFIRQCLYAYKHKGFDGKPIIFGPSGINDFIGTVLKVSELPMFIDAPGPLVKEVPDEYLDDSFKVKAFKTEHLSSKTLAYRFEINGKIVVFSGDTTYCPGIIDACRDADLVFIDSSHTKDEKTYNHLSTKQVAMICSESKVRKVVLCHILDYNQDKDLVTEVKEDFAGEVVLSEDLMTFCL